MTGPQAARRAGITYRQLDHWCRKGYLGEQHQKALGHGYQRSITNSDLVRLTHLARLVQVGIAPDRAVQLLEESSALIVDEHLVIDRPGVRLILEAAGC